MTATQSLTNQLATLFKGSETWLGVFYPRKYIIATFSSFETAVSGKQALRAAGFGPDEIRAVSGGEMLHFFREMQVRTGLLGDLMTEFRGNCRTPEIPLVRQTRRSVDTGPGLYFDLD